MEVTETNLAADQTPLAEDEWSVSLVATWVAKAIMHIMTTIIEISLMCAQEVTDTTNLTGTDYLSGQEIIQGTVLVTLTPQMYDDTHFYSGSQKPTEFIK